MVQETPSSNDAPQPAQECGSGARCGNGLEKIYPTTAVRFGQMRYVGEFTHPAKMKFACGAKVVVQTKRGIEIGEQVSLSCTGCEHTVTRDQIKEYIANSGQDCFELQAGRILREATSEDLTEYTRILEGAGEKRGLCQNLAGRHKLEMRVVSCEPLFGGERIIFYFVSEGRVDFRSLVKDLAREFQTRIEMRQVGARDEARLVADFETCGRECCCRTFLKSLKPVSMKMAKMQKATLDPSKVSGRCGRLKCCLRYEHTSYEELDRQLPKVGAKVRTTEGTGKVISRQILTQLVQIATDSGGRLALGVEDILGPDDGTVREPPRPPAPTPANRREQKAEPTEKQPAKPGGERPKRGRGGGSRRRSKGKSEEQTPRTTAPPPATVDKKASGDVPAEAPPETAAGEGTTEGGTGGAKRKRRRRRPRGRRGARPGGDSPGGKTDGSGPPAGESPQKKSDRRPPGQRGKQNE